MECLHFLDFFLICLLHVVPKTAKLLQSVYPAYLLNVRHQVHQEERVRHIFNFDDQSFTEMQIIGVDVNRLFFSSFQVYNHTKFSVGLGPLCANCHIRFYLPSGLGAIKRFESLGDSVGLFCEIEYILFVYKEKTCFLHFQSPSILNQLVRLLVKFRHQWITCFKLFNIA